jgi:hypothetical protein
VQGNPVPKRLVKITLRRNKEKRETLNNELRKNSVTISAGTNFVIPLTPQIGEEGNVVGGSKQMEDICRTNKQKNCFFFFFLILLFYNCKKKKNKILKMIYFCKMFIILRFKSELKSQRNPEEEEKNVKF